jgi:hypothetical protein
VDDSDELHIQATECLKKLRSVRDPTERGRLLALMMALSSKADALDRVRWAAQLSNVH